MKVCKNCGSNDFRFNRCYPCKRAYNKARQGIKAVIPAIINIKKGNKF